MNKKVASFFINVWTININGATLGNRICRETVWIIFKRTLFFSPLKDTPWCISRSTFQTILSRYFSVVKLWYCYFFFLPSRCFGYLSKSFWGWQVPLTMAGSCCIGILLDHKSFLFATVIKLVSIVSRLFLLSGIKLNVFVIRFPGWALLIVKLRLLLKKVLKPAKWTPTF